MTYEEAIKILEVNVICSPKATQFKEAVEVITNEINRQKEKIERAERNFTAAKVDVKLKKEEIERLQKENEFHRKTITENAQRALEVLVDEINKAKAEAIKKFAHQLKILLETKAKLYSLSDKDCEFAIVQSTALKTVDNLVKEMAGE